MNIDTNNDLSPIQHQVIILVSIKWHIEITSNKGIVKIW